MKVGTDGILLGAWAQAAQPNRILDIGTGTGLIALMMAQRFPNAIVDSVEIESNAAEQELGRFFNKRFLTPFCRSACPGSAYWGIPEELRDTRKPRWPRRDG